MTEKPENKENSERVEMNQFAPSQKDHVINHPLKMESRERRFSRIFDGGDGDMGTD